MLSTALSVTGGLIFLSYTPFLIRKWRQYRLRRIAPEYPRAKVVEKRISEKRRLLVCQTFFLEGRDSFFSTKGEIKKVFIVVGRQQYDELQVGSEVVIEKEWAFTSTDNRTLVLYTLYTEYPEALDFFWNKEKILNLCG